MFRGPFRSVLGPRHAQQMLAMGKKLSFRIASFAFGDAVLATMRISCKAAGGTIVGTDRVPVETNEISSSLLKIRQAKPDLVVSGWRPFNPILKQFKEFE